jgi:sulfonate transport system ATP-binding protein
LLVTHDVHEAVTLADRVILLEQGHIGLDIAIDLPRPRQQGQARLASLESQILERIFSSETQATQSDDARRSGVN